MRMRVVAAQGLAWAGGLVRGVFFFSSRRRHTRFDCDWSSDVCSSDLRWRGGVLRVARPEVALAEKRDHRAGESQRRSEEHTSELQSQSNLVCRLLLEKKKKLISIRYCAHKWLRI